MMKHLRTRAVEQSEYVGYWNKAEEFYEVMGHAFKNRMWAAVGLNAVYCVISVCDALLVKSQGIRAAEDDHIRTLELLASAPIAGIEKQVTMVRRIIAKKNIIAYESREFRESEASDIFKQAERFYRWAFEYLNKK
ncbi:MAG: HEPN domain-containing protein [Candidatus Omnitrophota bacterium]